MTMRLRRTALLWAIGSACRSPAGPSAAPVDTAAQADTAAGAGPAHGEHSHAMHTMHHEFKGAESWAKRFDDPARDAWQKPDEVIAWLGLAPGDVVADVGAGTGYFAMRLAKAVPQGKVLASDIEPDMVRYLGERAAKEGITNVVTIQGAAGDPRLGETAAAGAPTVVLLCDVAHHIADRPAFFTRVREQLAPGGRVVIIDFEPDAPEGAPGPPKAYRLAASALAAELVRAGLVVSREDHELLPYQYLLELRAD